MNKNPQWCMISVQDLSVLWIFLSQNFVYLCMKEMFWHAQSIAVCADDNSLYFCSDEIEWMKYLHHPHNSFLHQEQKHLDIQYKILTHMTNLDTWYIYQEIHTYWQMHNPWSVGELILNQLIQHKYMWGKCFLYKIVQLILLLMNLRSYLYISVAAYFND